MFQKSGVFSDVSTCRIHTNAPARGVVSYEGYTDSTFLDHRYEDDMLQCQSTQCWSEYCPTCHGSSSRDLEGSPPGRGILNGPQNCGV
ncbi:unnamed protein product [Heligmosomoides polygyrus]|uniref:Zinc finger protein n=1 Tax=Heligmosomoides polygyrus TaxID=6339 RepID=A0A183FPI2_HELPZ|nr:unnamed protein product [Heligmosomoides polygyrus]